MGDGDAGRLRGGLAVVRLGRIGRLPCRRTSSRSGEDTTDLRDAVAVSAGAWGVRLRADVLSVTCRNRDGRSLLLRIMEAFRSHRFPAVVEGLAPSGLRLWVRTGSAPRETLDDLDQVLRALLDDAAGQAVHGGWMGPDSLAEPPLTTRGAEVAYLLSPATVEEASRVLEAVPPDGARVADVLGELVHPKTLDYLRVPSTGEDSDPLSSAVASLVMQPATRGLTDGTIGRLLLAFPAGQYARVQHGCGNPGYLTWRIGTARKLPAPWVDRHRAAAHSVDWSDPLLGDVLSAHHRHARGVLDPGDSYAVSPRTLVKALGGHVGRRKVDNRNGRLVALGWLAPVPVGPGETSRWRLTVPEHVQERTSSAPLQARTSKPSRPSIARTREDTGAVLHDARHVLGEAAMRVFDLLDERRPQAPEEIAAVLGVTSGNVRRYLNRLAVERLAVERVEQADPDKRDPVRFDYETWHPASGAVSDADGGWLRAEGWRGRLDGIAEDHGVVGHGAHRVNVMQAEQDARSRYRAWKLLTSERLTTEQVAERCGWTVEETDDYLDWLHDTEHVERHTDGTWTGVPEPESPPGQAPWRVIVPGATKAVTDEGAEEAAAIIADDLDPFADELERQHREHEARYEARWQARQQAGQPDS